MCMIFQVSCSANFMWLITIGSHYPDILQLQGWLHTYVECAQHAMWWWWWWSSSSSVLQPWVDLGLLKQMLPTTSILGICLPIPPPSFLASSSTPSINLDFGQPHPRWPPGFVPNVFLGNSFSSIRTTWPAHLSLLDFIMLTIFGSL